jgi:hypothetical protein
VSGKGGQRKLGGSRPSLPHWSGRAHDAAVMGPMREVSATIRREEEGMGVHRTLLARSSHGHGTTGAPSDVTAVRGHCHVDRSSVPRSTGPAFPQSKKGEGVDNS